jgi:dTDP-4-amino-4,6-dideoxygalactose transaminase
VSAPRVPLLDLRRQYAAIKAEIDEAVAEVLAAQTFIGGEPVRRFEAEFAAHCGTRHAIGTSSGSTALHAALLAAGVRPGDEVIVPAMTFAATAEAVVHCGARPVFVDSEPETLCLDARAVEAAITSRTRAVVPVHLYGQLAPMEEINALAAAAGAVVVEDAAQAFLARSPAGAAGNLGRFGCFSLYPSKNLGAYGDGGVIVTSDDDAADWLRKAVNHGRTSKHGHDFIGYNFRLDALQAAVCTVKLRHIARWTERRRALARRYDERLAGLPVTPLRCLRGHAHHLYVIEAPARDALRSHLEAQGIGCAVHYTHPLHQEAAFRPYAPAGGLPVAERAAGRVLALPLFPELGEEEQDRVVAAMTSFDPANQRTVSP